MELFGSLDFVQYWSAYQLLIRGADPYDPQLTLAMQCSVGLHCEYPRTTYTPPWLWLLMSPVLMHPFETAAKLWTQASVVLVMLSGVIVAWVFRLSPGGAVLTAGVTLASFPLVIDLLFGQLSSVLLVGTSLLFVGRCRGLPWLDGAGLVLLSAKPHLFLPLAAAVGVNDLRRRHYQTVIWVLVFLIPLVGIAEFLSAGAVRDWLFHLLFPRTDLGVRAAVGWPTDAPAAALARALADDGQAPPRWPLLIASIGGVVFGIVTGWVTKNYGGWCRRFPWLVWLGLATSPFVWFSDFAILNFLIATAVAHLYAAGARRRAVVIAATSAACHVLLQRLEYADIKYFRLDHMFWFPFAVLALWALAAHRSPRADRTAAAG